MVLGFFLCSSIFYLIVPYALAFLYRFLWLLTVVKGIDPKHKVIFLVFGTEIVRVLFYIYPIVPHALSLLHSFQLLVTVEKNIGLSHHLYFYFFCTWIFACVFLLFLKTIAIPYPPITVACNIPLSISNLLTCHKHLTTNLSCLMHNFPFGSRALQFHLTLSNSPENGIERLRRDSSSPSGINSSSNSLAFQNLWRESNLVIGVMCSFFSSQYLRSLSNASTGASASSFRLRRSSSESLELPWMPSI